MSSSSNQDIYHTDRTDVVMLKSKYFDFDRKIFISIPSSYAIFDAMDFDVVYTTDAQTKSQFDLE